jgi:hypothetical protein
LRKFCNEKNKKGKSAKEVSKLVEHKNRTKRKKELAAGSSWQLHIGRYLARAPETWERVALRSGLPLANAEQQKVPNKFECEYSKTKCHFSLICAGMRGTASVWKNKNARIGPLPRSF